VLVSPAAQPASGPDILESLLVLVQEMSGLPREALDPGAPFSSLGLDSIFLVQLAENLAARHGLRVSFSQLAQFNTAGTLAAALEAQAPSARAIEAPTRPTSPAAPGGFHGLFPLRRGDDRLPILLIHGDVANDFLPARLPPEQTIFGYGHQGSDGELIELRTVDDLAARCFSEWTAAFKGAPCVVAGHSYGGLVALSLVHLMRREGMPVELLLLIDAYHPRYLQNPYPPGLRRLRRGARLTLEQLRLHADVLRGDLELRVRGRVPISRRNPYVLGVYELAARRFVPPPLDVEAVLISATEGEESFRKLPFLGWDPAAFRSLSDEHAPGDHLSIVRNREAVDAVAASFARHLARLRGRVDGAGRRTVRERTAALMEVSIQAAG
jgi:thioesterase domain-containing protein/aryl carrier-like protein